MYISISIFVIGIIFIITVLPWQKNAYQDEMDPDIMELNLEETVEKFGLTKLQFNSRYSFIEPIKVSE